MILVTYARGVLSEQAGAGESASGNEVPRCRTPGPHRQRCGLRLRGAVAGAARPLLEDGERPGRSAADGGADRKRTGRGVWHLRTGTAGPAHRVHRGSVRRAGSRVVQPAQAAPKAAAQPLRVLSAGDRGWRVGRFDGPAGRSVQCRRSLCDPRPRGRQLVHGGHESLPQEGQGAPPGRAGRRPERRSAAPQADRRVSVHQVDLQLGRGHAILLAGRLAVKRSALRRGALIIALLSGLWADVDGARAAEELVVYSGRKEVAVKPIVDACEKKTGIPGKIKTCTTTGLAHEF